MQWAQKQKGFTIVELLIVIVVIAILAAITIVAYTGIQARSKDSATKSQLQNVAKILELYKADNGGYPDTGGLGYPIAEAGCASGTNSSNWVPGVVPKYINALPVSTREPATSASHRGCFAYASDGTQFILSAWNIVRGGPQTGDFYKRFGFVENLRSAGDGYRCNHINVGGSSSGSYVATSDIYKHSYTISNVTSCNETPPAGA